MKINQSLSKDSEVMVPKNAVAIVMGGNKAVNDDV